MTRKITHQQVNAPISVSLIHLLHHLLDKVDELEAALSTKAPVTLLEEKVSAIERRLYDTKEILNARELCEYLNVQPGYLHKLTSKKLIPYYRPFGKYLYFKKREIDQWIVSEPHLAKQAIQESKNAKQ